MGKVHLLSLGCPKNLVDSDSLLKKLAEHGINYTADPDDSDIIIVNTCGFIEEAKRESVEEILGLAKLKVEKKGKKLIVFGCLAQRFGGELKNEIPEIDAIWGVKKEDEIVEYCREVSLHLLPDVGSGNPVVPKAGLSGSKDPGKEAFFDRPYAYLKISEGCDRRCSYCAIPGIRGAYQSRDPEQILQEAENHIKSGIKELILIAQDITSYVIENRGYDLNSLIRDIASVSGDFWIRLLYLYPTAINDRLIETIGSEEKVCKYIDMPLQHSDEKILSLM